jgi:hypothetical protein
MSLEMKEQTVVAFLDVKGAYNNVLIDVLCSLMLDKELPVGLVRFLRNLLWFFMLEASSVRPA